MTRLLRCLVASWLVLAASVVDAGGLWINTHSGEQFIDTETGAARSIANAVRLRALLAPGDQAAWIVDDRVASLIAADGTLIRRIDLPAEAISNDGLAAVANPANGALYIAANQHVVVLYPDGASTVLPALPGSPLRLAVGVDNRLWAVLPDALWKLDNTGAWKRLRELNLVFSANLLAMAVDAVGGHVWLVSDAQALAIDVEGPATEPIAVALPQAALAATLDSESGTLWMVTATELAAANSMGALQIWPHDLPGLTAPVALQFEPASRSLWLVSGTKFYRWSEAALRTMLGIGADGALHLAGAHSTVIGKAAMPPTVSITAPANNAVFSAPASIPITATASATSGNTISKVDFYKGSSLLGTKTASPYTFNWTNVAAGTYSLTAKATDNKGMAATSSAVTVISNTPPTVSISAPANNAKFTAPASINVTANASAAKGNTISKVDYYAGSTLLGSDQLSPYAYAWSNVAAGTYSLTARATDSKGSVTTSSAVSVSVTVPPTVNITAPVNNASFTAPAAIAITASATAASGNTITKVEFYRGTTLLGTKTSSPYTYNWTGVAAGSYSITAKATDSRGGAATSSAVAVIVGAAPAVSITSPANNAKYTAPAAITIAADASAAAGNTISKVDFYKGSTLLGTATASPYTYAWNNVATGSYSLTAKATDSRGTVLTSSAVAVSVTAAPNVSITAPADGVSYTAPATIAIAANASAASGNTIAKVEFFNDATLLGAKSTSPYTFNWTNVAAGSYSLTAKATDSRGGAATSAAVGVNVVPVVALSVDITEPANNSTFANSANITVAVSAVPATGTTISKVEFYQGATLLGSATASPYNYNWGNQNVGSYTLTAKATDSRGIVIASAPVNITVVDSPPPTVSITSPPVSGLVFGRVATIPLAATASSAPGTTIAKVDYYYYSYSYPGKYYIGTATTSPFAVGWLYRNGPDTYSVTATATDSLGATATSDSVRVSVSTNSTIQLGITGLAYVVPATLTLNLAVIDPLGAIAKVEFYDGTTLLATRTNPPYTYVWNGVQPGSYEVFAIAYEHSGSSEQTRTYPIVVDGTLPTIAINSPADGTAFWNPAQISISGTLTGPSGTWAVALPNDPYLVLRATLNGTAFSIDVPDHALPTGPFYIPVSAFTPAGARVDTGVNVKILRPALWFVSPLDYAETLDDHVTVRGAFYAYANPQITINGAAATISGSEFTATVPLVVGENAITATLDSRQANGSNSQVNTNVRVLRAAASSRSITIGQIASTYNTYFGFGRTIAQVTGTYTGGVDTQVLVDNGVDARVVASVGSGKFTALLPLINGTSTITATAMGPSGPTVTTSANTPASLITTPAPYSTWVKITAPARCTVMTVVPATVTLAADVLPIGPSPVARVEFAQNGYLLGSSASPPYNYVWSNIPAGTYQVTARAVHANDSATVYTAPVTIIVTAGTSPLCTLTQPADGASFTTPATINMTANAMAPGSTVSKVEFFQGNSLIGTATSAPFSATWTNAPLGDYSLTAKATSASGASTTSAPARVHVGLPPTVTLTAPANNANLAAPATITLQVSVSAPGSTVSHVEYFQGAAPLGSTSGAPYSFTWANVAAGDYTFTAKVFNASGASAISAPVTVHVLTAPSVSVLSPGNGLTYRSGDSIEFTVQAVMPGHVLDRIDFYSDAALLATAPGGGNAQLTASVQWNGAGLGAHVLYAKAVATDGTSITSATVNINVVGPLQVALTSPANGSMLIAPASVYLNAQASEAGGVIAQVQFYQGSTLLATLTSPPYIHALNNVAAGNYSFSARATDSTGQSVTSNAVAVQVIAAAQLTVDSGIDGTSVNDDSINVSGTLLAPPNSGVTVNGVLAAIDGNGRYYANNIPLAPGANTLTITLTTHDGHTVTQAIGVTSTGPSPVAIRATPTRGLAPLQVTFNVSAQPGVVIQKVELDFTGDGAIDSTLLAPPWTIARTYTGSGVVRALIKVTDSQANVYTRSIPIVATDPAQLDQSLRALWGGMQGALVAGDKTGALRFLNSQAQWKYEPVFAALLPQMTQIIGTYSPLLLGELRDGYAEYAVARDVSGSKRLYFIYYTQDVDGVWRLDSM